MKKIMALAIAMMMVFAFAACGGEGGKSGANEYDGLVSAETNDLMLYVDGADVTDGNVKFEQIKDKFEVVEVDGVKYYAAALTDICAYDLSSVVAFFGETTDGFVRYYKDLANAKLAVLVSEDGETFTQVMNEDAPTYAMVLPEGNVLNGIKNVFMLTKSAEFSVPVKVDGEEIGVITLSDFMKKTAVGDKKVTTGMYDGSFKYKGGEATYKGRFLGIDLETMIAKLTALGMTIPAEYKEIEFYGTPGMGAPGKNTSYALYPDEDTYFMNASFFCMYDGMVNNPAVKDVDMGLTAWINGTGQKWVTYSLTEINFVTK